MDQTYHAVNDVEAADTFHLTPDTKLGVTQVSIVPLTAEGVPITDGSATGTVTVSAYALGNPLQLDELDLTLDLASPTIAKYAARLEGIVCVPTAISSPKYRVVVSQY